ncbi:MAG TPA: Na+/H+ antiporter NhaC family protein, partial [Tepidisphaeraceae bacterium]|nr:Na+/H+ antiporter NhaC family protein [Tepidisphaeraceae bacterium]
MPIEPSAAPNWISILPPLLAIVLAIWTRQVYLSLAAGIFAGCTILAGWRPHVGLANTVNEVVNVFADAGNTRVILFTLVIGALIATIEASGGVNGFVRSLERRGLVATPRRAGVMVFLIGVLVFVESNITILVGGAVGRPLFDRLKLSRERLAYLLDSTSAPICMLIPLNAWGALVLGLLAGNGIANPVEVMLASLPLNFYAIFAICLAGLTAVFQLSFGPMRRADARARAGETHWPNAQLMVDPAGLTAAHTTAIPPRAINMLLPIAAMVVAMPTCLYFTGDGDMRKGSGSTSVLWSVLIAWATAVGLLLVQRAFSLEQLTRIALKGASGLVPLAAILVLALALAVVAKQLGTGAYIANATRGAFPTWIFLPLLFLVSAVVAFSTGTSWGTFALMLPIAVPAAVTLGLPPAPFIAAALAGGVFGDHA